MDNPQTKIGIVRRGFEGRQTPQQEIIDPRLSERRQEFSATFNNALSSVKKEFESQQSQEKAIIPNFYPNLTDATGDELSISEIKFITK